MPPAGSSFPNRVTCLREQYAAIVDTPTAGGGKRNKLQEFNSAEGGEKDTG